MKKSLNLSGKIEGSLASLLIDLFSCASRLSIPTFIIGAMARDLVFNNFGIVTGRATRDLDIAIQVENLDQFTKLKNELLKTGHFMETRVQHRMFYDKDNLNVDIVPFGGIAQSSGSISWPPDQSVKMSVVGFEEAFQNALSAGTPLNPELEIKISSIVGLALLKIISWNENYPARKKDAKDLEFIMRNYADAGNHERFYEEMSDVIESEDYDYELASARFLGRDVARIAKPDTSVRITGILTKQTRESDHFLLAEDMINNQVFDNKKLEGVRNLLKSFVKGLSEIQ